MNFIIYSLPVLLMFLLAAGPAYADVMMKSAEKNAPPVTETTPAPVAEFTLADKDILAWEESGEAKYIYFALTDEKNEELAVLTKENLGKTIQINLNENFIIIPKVTSVLDQKKGFVLLVPEGRRLEIIRQLDLSKKIEAKTEISIGTETAPDKAGEKEAEKTEQSGPADSAP